MARPHLHTAQSQDSGGHAQRPWVYFMIDCFFLVTQFFVITFHIKVDDAVLPQKMPPGGETKDPRPLPSVESLHVHVAQVDGVPIYQYLREAGSLADFEAVLRRTKDARRECVVKISYEPAVLYRDVLAVVNACSKLDIRKCGLMRLRGTDAAPGG